MTSLVIPYTNIRAIPQPHTDKNPSYKPNNEVDTVTVRAADMVQLFLGILQEHCGGFGRGSGALLRMLGLRSLAVRTKPSSVLPERKLLMRLDGVCRHYLAMTKSALFLCADGGKFSRGSSEKHQ